ncbi:MAG: ammonia-forming cytochrome c nitrite reductase subunit c552 [Sphingobacteriales bacterium]
MKMNRSVLTTGILTLALFLVVSLLEYCKPKPETLSAGANDFVGDQSCQSCHKKEYDLYKQSDHFRAMMPATDSTVLGNFNNSTLTADGVTSTFFKKDGKYFINTEGPDGKNQDFEVIYTFGFKPLQQYLIAFDGGRYQVPRVSWDVVNKKWFHQYSGQKIHHRDWLHWTGAAQNWNTMCASCHSTNLKKNYDLEKDNFHTTWTGITVSCESCHGPGKKHIEFATTGGYANGKKEQSFLLPLNASNRIQVNSCAPCHARRAEIGQFVVDAHELLNTHIPEIPTTEFFHADGQVDDEDYIYTSFLQSKMFHRQVTCSNCHNAHSGKLVKPVTQVCRQCHEPSYESFEHTRHVSTQVNCVSCHMPSKVYMGNDVRHDHSFRVPRPDQSVAFGTPNACNNCHTDKTAKWSADAVVKWFGVTRKYHFSDDLIPGSKGDFQAERNLQKLWADTSVPDIVKATAIHYMRNIQTISVVQTVKKALAYPDAQVRYRAVQTLSVFPLQQWKDDVLPLLHDKVKAVRIAAADALLAIGNEQIPGEYTNAYEMAKKELQDYLLYQADFSVGNVMIGDFYYRQRDLFNAEKFYWRGLKKDSMMNYVRFNLSALYNSQMKNAEALNILNQARLTDPSNPRVYYQLALLQVEMNDRKAAETNFNWAVKLGSNEPRLYYNYGLLKQQDGQIKEAETVFLKGLTIDPENVAISYALAVLYIQQGNKVKAAIPAKLLRKKDPQNPDFQALFAELGI